LTTKLISKLKKKPVVSSKRLSREDWIAAAQKELVNSGIEAVKIDLIAKKLGVTRGGFYWHFTDRADLLRRLLRHWEDVNTEPLIKAIAEAGARGLKEDFDSTVGRLLMEETEFSPKFDSAVRNWAQADQLVLETVLNVDERRISAFQAMFEKYGFKGDVALVRARIIYFHQIGYYALAIKETLEQRRKLIHLYNEILIQ
jgi:AcrR family transcriptional regulator